MAAQLPADVLALEEQYRAVVTTLAETSEGLAAIRSQLETASTDAEKQELARQAADLRVRARRLKEEAAELRIRAAAVQETSLKLKAIAGAP